MIRNKYCWVRTKSTESSTVEIKQKGKDNKTATVEQVKTSFTTNSIKNLKITDSANVYDYRK